MRVLVVVLPQRSDFVLTPDVPDGEGHALYGGHGLHIETYGREGGHNLVQLYLVQNCCLAFEKKIPKIYMTYLLDSI